MATSKFDIKAYSEHQDLHECPLCGITNFVKYTITESTDADNSCLVIHGKLGCGMCHLYLEEETLPNPSDYTKKALIHTLRDDWNRLTVYPEDSARSMLNIFMDAYESRSR